MSGFFLEYAKTLAKDNMQIEEAKFLAKNQFQNLNDMNSEKTHALMQEIYGNVQCTIDALKPQDESK